MPVILIKPEGGRFQRVQLQRGPALVVGRAPDAGLVLPHASVSRHHVKITGDDAGWFLEDLDSQNGVVVNGWKLQGPHALRSEDVLHVGRFLLVFLGDGKEHAFYQGRCVAYLPMYTADPYAGAENDDDNATEMVRPEDLEHIARENQIHDHARVRDLDQVDSFWYPEGQPLTFGRAGIIPVGGWFAAGVVAEVKWDGRRHTLTRHSTLVAVSLNDVGLDGPAPLRVGDRITVGDRSFVYEVVES